MNTLIRSVALLAITLTAGGLIRDAPTNSRDEIRGRFWRGRPAVKQFVQGVDGMVHGGRAHATTTPVSEA